MGVEMAAAAPSCFLPGPDAAVVCDAGHATEVTEGVVEIQSSALGALDGVRQVRDGAGPAAQAVLVRPPGAPVARAADVEPADRTHPGDDHVYSNQTLNLTVLAGPIRR